MRRISGNIFFQKRIFPVIWFGFLAFFVFTAALNPGKHGFPLPALIIPAFMAVFGYFIMKRLVFNLMDEMWDDGDALVARNKGIEARISLANIINVSSSTNTNPPRITLTLREPCVFGKEVCFSPPRQFLGFSLRTTHPLAAELIERIDEKRRAR